MLDSGVATAVASGRIRSNYADWYNILGRTDQLMLLYSYTNFDELTYILWVYPWCHWYIST